MPVLDGLTSIVVLTRDRLEFSRRCLETIARTTEPLEWVVVDNGSSDGTREHLSRWRSQAPELRTVVYNGRSTGAARARNRGWRRARGEWIAFLDNDVYLDGDPGWLASIVAILGMHAHVLAVSPLLLFPGSPEIVQCAGGGVTAGGRFGLLGRGMRCAPEHEVVRPQAWAPTAALVVRRSALEAVGGFDEGFDPVPICEDLDLCCRLRAMGGKIVFDGGARLRHSEGTTFGHLGYDKKGYWSRHARVVKARWGAVLCDGPIHHDRDIAWREVRKEYDDFEAQHVSTVGPSDGVGRDMSFFASAATLEASPPPLRVGVIGCGQAALRGALPGLASCASPLAGDAAPFLAFGGCERVIVAAVADVDANRAQEAATRASATSWTTDGHELLSCTPLEGVVVATPPRWHAEYALAALEHHLPVLVEKPGAANEGDLERLLAAVTDSANAFCMINLPWEFHPGVHALAAALAEGLIGVVRSVSVVFGHAGPAKWAPRATWYFDRDGGGVIRDLGLHAVAALERVLDARIVQLTPVGGSHAAHAAATTSVHDVCVRVEVAWDAPWPRFAITTRGTMGTCRLELIPYRARCTKLYAEGRSITLETAREAINGGPYRHFVDRLRQGEEPLTDFARRAPGLRAVLQWAQAVEHGAT